MAKFNVNRVKAGDLELKDKVVAINRVVKTRMTFEVPDVLDRAGRKIVDDVDFIATLNVGIT